MKDINMSLSNNTNKPLPLLCENKEDCCGCSACYAVCSVSSKSNNRSHYVDTENGNNKLGGAISMIADDEGFLYPEINEIKCIRCYRCVEICPFR